MNKIFIFSIGIVLGIIYYMIMKNSIKKHYKNCSFVSNKETDILAFIVGLIIFYLGFFKYNDNILIILSMGIISEHILQISYKF